MAQEKTFLRGYSMVLHSFLMYWIYGTLIGGGLSVIVAQYCGMTGLDSNLVTSVNTVGGFLSVIMTFLIGRWVITKGIRGITAFSCIGTAVGLCILGNGTGLGIYILWSVVSQGLYNGYSFTATNALIANWFPREKGWVMGITTAGMMAASFTSVLFITVYSPKIGFTNVCYILAAVIAMLGLVSLKWIVETPEQCGLLPDNMPLTEQDRQAFGGGAARQDWRAGKLLCSRDGICYVIGFGLLFIATTGGITAFVPYMVERSYSPVDAVGLMSLTSLFSLIGSFIIGVLDSKLGTKKASLIFAALYAIGYSGAFFLNGTDKLFLLPLWLAMASGGANANLMASALVSQYGRANYASVWSVLFTGASLIRNLCYLLIGTIVSWSGTYARVYLFWGIISAFSLVLLAISDFNYRAPHHYKKPIQ